MDNSAAQSLGSLSSTSATKQVPDPNGVSPSTNNPGEFVNHGLLLWNQNRQQWVGKKRDNNRSQQKHKPILSWNATYDSLLGSNKQFTQPIPLAEMVEFLVDIWEQEGHYD